MQASKMHPIKRERDDMFLKKVTLASAFAITAGTAYAGCEISGNVSIVGNEFPPFTQLPTVRQPVRAAT